MNNKLQVCKKRHVSNTILRTCTWLIDNIYLPSNNSHTLNTLDTSNLLIQFINNAWIIDKKLSTITTIYLYTS